MKDKKKKTKIFRAGEIVLKEDLGSIVVQWWKGCREDTEIIHFADKHS